MVWAVVEEGGSMLEGHMFVMARVLQTDVRECPRSRKKIGRVQGDLFYLFTYLLIFSLVCMLTLEAYEHKGMITSVANIWVPV